MNLTTVDNLLLSELRDLYSAEKQLTKALPKMVKAAVSPALEDIFQEHLDQTKEHVSRLEQAFELLGEKPKEETCKAMKGLIEEGEDIIKADGDDLVRDAALIVGAQKVEHYEIAGYGSARTLAQLLGHSEVAELLDETLEEEKETDANLTELAENEINVEAAEEEEEEE